MMNFIEPHLSNQIKLLSLEDFITIETSLYEDKMDSVLLYVFDHLNNFQEQKTLSKYKGDHSILFYWDVADDPIIPYLVGEPPVDFRNQISKLKRQYFSISLDKIGNDYLWNLYLFTKNPFINLK
ncbi:hypothetical protein [Virgibacillus oceani]|uniref:Uncharacterized protein n=1 Tax=Virgibacillus oceani TaxID=1479511 RepID=A0A917M8W2_9BACI|nr:hypothetical protein [Virgibacillus oceani]GGG85135.1 hypothetical protein GCM10011398_33600 [Virgibacillus oceani]